jgi:hypothetical protein
MATVDTYKKRILEEHEGDFIIQKSNLVETSMDCDDNVSLNL